MEDSPTGWSFSSTIRWQTSLWLAEMLLVSFWLLPKLAKHVDCGNGFFALTDGVVFAINLGMLALVALYWVGRVTWLALTKRRRRLDYGPPETVEGRFTELGQIFASAPIQIILCLIALFVTTYSCLWRYTFTSTNPWGNVTTVTMYDNLRRTVVGRKVFTFEQCSSEEQQPD